MSGSEIAALIVAITGALAAIFAGVRNLRGDAIKAEVAAAAAVLTGYTNLAGVLQAELERVKAEYVADRKGWAEERVAMRAEHAQELAAFKDTHRREIQAAYERIDELSAKIYTLENRPSETRERRSDRDAEH